MDRMDIFLQKQNALWMFKNGYIKLDEYLEILLFIDEVEKWNSTKGFNG